MRARPAPRARASGPGPVRRRRTARRATTAIRRAGSPRPGRSPGRPGRRRTRTAPQRLPRRTAGCSARPARPVRGRAPPAARRPGGRRARRSRPPRPRPPRHCPCLATARAIATARASCPVPPVPLPADAPEPSSHRAARVSTTWACTGVAAAAGVVAGAGPDGQSRMRPTRAANAVGTSSAASRIRTPPARTRRCRVAVAVPGSGRIFTAGRGGVPVPLPPAYGRRITTSRRLRIRPFSAPDRDTWRRPGQRRRERERVGADLGRGIHGASLEGVRLGRHALHRPNCSAIHRTRVVGCPELCRDVVRDRRPAVTPLPLRGPPALRRHRPRVAPGLHGTYAAGGPCGSAVS